MGISKIFRDAVEKEASDIFVVAGLAISFKIHGVIQSQGDNQLKASETEGMVRQVYTSAGRDMQKFLEEGDDDFSSQSAAANQSTTLHGT